MATEDPHNERVDDGRSDAVAVVLALAVGALFVAVALYTYRPPVSSDQRTTVSSSSASSFVGPTAAEELRRQSRIRAFIDNQVAARDVVLFVDAASASSSASYVHFQRLFAAVFPTKVKVTVAVVDLATTAQGKKILKVLQELPLASPLHVEHGTKQQQQKQTDFLFVKGVLVGDYSRVRQLLVSGSLASELAKQGVACDLDGIRVARHSDSGFIVLGPQNCFQSVNSSPSDTENAVLRLETRPLDTVEELLSADTASLLPSQPPQFSLAERARNPLRRSKLLVCHDMKGGYLGDRFVQGSADFDAYRFYQWDLVDLFVYFGHHLVCIPPVGWIAAGHRNGTRVLGAFVTEGDHGAALSAQVFQSQKSAEKCAHKLAAIAALQGFDGYLVNIENSVDKELLVNVIAFLKTLSTQLKAVSPDAQVIWYASLRRDGHKKHQMRLDTDGVPFFRCVDGFFTDYGWTADDAKYSAAFDLDRRFDVFMGVDVFGRHDTLGGGKMNCDVPLRTAWNAGVSAALFAPGWTHECLQHEADAEDDFVAVEERFWTKIRSVWKARSPSFNVFGGRDSLYSAFNAGRGKSVWVDGVRHDKATEWSNLLEMDQQPVASLHAGVTVQTRDSTLRAVLSHETAFQGGSCISIQGDMGSKDKAYVKLFDADMELSARRITEISYTTSQQTDGSVVLLVLTVVPGLDRPAHQVILRSTEDRGDGGANGSELSSALSGVAGQSPGKHFYSPVWTREYSSNDGTWVKKTYRLGGMIWDQKHIVEIGVLCTKKRNNNTSKTPLDCKYRACVGEVCVVGNANVRNRTSLGTIATEPKRCANARVTEFRRLDSESVAFRVHWQLAEESGCETVQYMLVFLRERSDSKKRTLLGKSFGLSFDVEKCLWEKTEGGAEEATSSLLHLELVSVAWTGAGACADGCNVNGEKATDHLGEMKTGVLALFFVAALCASAAHAERPEVKRHTALTAPLPLTQGEVTNTFHRLPIPKGPIAVYRFEADVVEKDAEGNVIPVGNYDAYLHHHVVGSVHKHYAESANKWAPMKPVNFSRSVGFGAGTESRGTPQEFKYPYAFMTVEGEDEWVANVHVINTRKMSAANAHHCLECPCTSEDVITADTVNGMHFIEGSCNADLRFENNTVCSAKTYHGGLRCCEDSQFCLEKADLAREQETSTFYLRYTIEYSEIVPENRPLYLAGCCDASGDENHHGNVEYDVPKCDPELHPGCVHTLATRQALDLGQNSVYSFTQGGQNFEDREVELVYAVGHQHRGGLGIQMFDEKSGDLLCSAVPTYGTGHEVGNENGYVVSISTCTFDPPRRMRASDLVRIVALYNNTEAHTGVMSLMYLALSDVVVPSDVTNAAVVTEASSGNLLVRFVKSPFMVVGPVVAAVGCVIIFALHMKKRHGYHQLDTQSPSI